MSEESDYDFGNVSDSQDSTSSSDTSERVHAPVIEEDLLLNLETCHTYFPQELSDFTNRENMIKIRSELLKVVDEAQEMLANPKPSRKVSGSRRAAAEAPPGGQRS